MESITESEKVNAPVATVWASWVDFGDVHRFNPWVSSSRLLSDKNSATGIGARRESELSDGKNWLRERITDYQTMRQLKLEVYESSLPISWMHVTVVFREMLDGSTEVTMTSEFEAAKGIIGKMLAQLMRRRLRPMLAALLEGNKAYVERSVCTRKAA